VSRIASTLVPFTLKTDEHADPQRRSGAGQIKNLIHDG
jgi:hypothetical protein